MPDTDSNKKSASKTAPTIRAYLGGSFDPVHNGHIQMAMHVYDCLAPIAKQQQRMLQVSLLPNARSPFKTQSTDPAHRLAMLTLAIQNTPLQISDLELGQTPPVYSIDSVRALRQRYPNDSLIFIMGMDSARNLEKWKNGLQLTNYVHLWIFDRSNNRTNSLTSDFTTDLINHSDVSQPIASIGKEDNQQNLSTQHINTLSFELPTLLQAQITQTSTDLIQPLNDAAKKISHKDNKPLKNNAQGRIYIDSRPVPAISSTQIRKQLRQQLYQQVYKQLPTDDFTANNKPNNLTHLLNPAVYQYIIAHQLYSAAQFR